MPALPTNFATSVTAKLLVIGFLALVLLIPIAFVGGLNSERADRAEAAKTEIAATWGQPQTLAGPVLAVPYATTQKNEKGEVMHTTSTAYFLPEKLQITGELKPEVRQRGIFSAVVYRGQLTFAGSFRPDLAKLGLNASQLNGSGTRVLLHLTDVRNLTGETALQLAGGAAHPFESTEDGLSASLDSFPASSQFSFQLNFAGSESLQFAPVGRETTVNLAANWPTPKFFGAFLPTQHAETERDFRAEWQVSHFGRQLPQQWTGTLDLPADGGTLLTEPTETMPAGSGAGYLAHERAFGVELYQPVDFYQKIERALKYALLFSAFTFTAFFLFETLRGLRLHPLQYVLVGLALALFYLLLLAFTEEIGFGPAYALAASGTVGLIAAYCASVLGGWRSAAVIAGLLTGLYGYLYFLLQMEERALLFGALALFAVLAAVMWLTRKIDWYAVKLDR